MGDGGGFSRKEAKTSSALCDKYVDVFVEESAGREARLKPAGVDTFRLRHTTA